ncbi:hypothetical protein DPX16_12387 [Anabarilius grahami]|uniref:Urokinase plasminogen activator surface receptor n=1 Tax=Anabarilius grahami TaxID=495550 RepID=A0A3N0XIL7_ANAGA|nr:hypothetical protein DPX16_12387 [Anabarilius grahami]
MALQIIRVLLFTVFFSKALTLECYNCPTIAPSGTCTQTANCSSNLQCSYKSTYNGDSKSCIDSALCANWSINVGQYDVSSYCCASNRCNNAPAADPENGLMCYTCSETNCSNTQTLKCKGVDTQCFNAAASDSENGLMCYTCSDKNCSNTQTQKCKGEENQCITTTGDSMAY